MKFSSLFIFVVMIGIVILVLSLMGGEGIKEGLSVEVSTNPIYIDENGIEIQSEIGANDTLLFSYKDDNGTEYFIDVNGGLYTYTDGVYEYLYDLKDGQYSFDYNPYTYDSQTNAIDENVPITKNSIFRNFVYPDPNNVSFSGDTSQGPSDTADSDTADSPSTAPPTNIQPCVNEACGMIEQTNNQLSMYFQQSFANMMQPIMQRVMDDIALKVTTSGNSGSGDYIPKSEIVPPVYPYVLTCPMCSQSDGVCNYCGGQGGSGTSGVSGGNVNGTGYSTSGQSGQSGQTGQSGQNTDEWAGVSNNLINTTGNTLDNAVNVTGNTATGLATTFVDGAGNIVDSAGNVINKTVDSAGNVINKTVDSAGNVINTTVDSAGNVINTTVGTVGNIGQDVVMGATALGAGAELLGSQAIGTVGNAVQGAGSGLYNLAAGTGNGLYNLATGGGGPNYNGGGFQNGYGLTANQASGQGQGGVPFDNLFGTPPYSGEGEGGRVRRVNDDGSVSSGGAVNDDGSVSSGGILSGYFSPSPTQPIDNYSAYGALVPKGSDFMPLTASFAAFSK